jgi:hypothetical protein
METTMMALEVQVFGQRELAALIFRGGRVMSQ